MYIYILLYIYIVAYSTHVKLVRVYIPSLYNLPLSMVVFAPLNMASGFFATCRVKRGITQIFSCFRAHGNPQCGALWLA
jgi:hypothetical protein